MQGADQQAIDMIYHESGSPETSLSADDLKRGMVAAHLIHGSSEGRFNITYCPGKGEQNLSRQEIESVGFKWADFDEVTARYNPATPKDGYNTLPDGEEVFYISSPALGLWACRDRFTY
jgi:hypothetical protein